MFSTAVEKVEIFVFTEESSIENMQTVGDFRLIIPKHDGKYSAIPWTVTARTITTTTTVRYSNRKLRFHALRKKEKKKEKKKKKKKKKKMRKNFKIKFLDSIAHSRFLLERVVLLASQDARNMKGQGMIERNFELAVLRTKALSMKIS